MPSSKVKLQYRAQASIYIFLTHIYGTTVDQRLPFRIFKTQILTTLRCPSIFWQSQDLSIIFFSLISSSIPDSQYLRQQLYGFSLILQTPTLPNCLVYSSKRNSSLDTNYSSLVCELLDVIPIILTVIEFIVLQNNENQILFKKLLIIQIAPMSKYVGSQNASEETNNRKIDWKDYNYPICLKIFHFDANETPQYYKWRVLSLRLNHWLIIFACLWNFINNIVGAAQGVDQGVIRIFISIFLFFLWLPFSFYIFIIPYHEYMKKDDKVWLYYTLSGIAAVWFFIWSIADFADANGWVMVSQSSKEDRGANAFFAVITSITMTIIVILTIYNMVRFCRRQKDDD